MKKNVPLEIQSMQGNDDWSDDNGQWSKVCDVFASLMPSSGREFNDNERVASEVTHTMRINFDERIKPTMRALEKRTGRTFEFVSVIDRDERRHEMVINAKEIT